MGERKVQAKYYPPDFDPSRLPRIKKKRENDDAVRFMLPMSVRCEKCGEFMGTGLKFNARKSDTGDDYLGIKIFRFSMRCKACPSTFTIRTDPKNSDYSCESGVRRNYEPWREKELAQEEGKEERNRQDEDAMQALENKTLDAKKQMDDLDELDDIKSSNAKRAAISVDDVVAMGKAMEQSRKDVEEEHIRAEAKAAFDRRASSAGQTERKLRTAKDAELTSRVRARGPLGSTSHAGHNGFKLTVKKVIKKQIPAPVPPKPGLTALIDYGSSSDSA